MRRPKKSLLVALVCAAAGALAPAAAPAAHCADRMVVFSGQRGLPKPNPNAAICTAGNLGGVETPDTRLIMPAATELLVRWVGDFGADVPTIQATLDGLGFDGATISLARVTSGLTPYYESGPIALQAASGCIQAELTAAFGGAAAGSTAFHTIDAACD